MAYSTPSSLRHRWSDHDRIVVALLFVYFEIPARELTDIFNRICSDRLSAEGFGHGLPFSTIRSQLGDLRGEGSGCELYNGIEGMSFQEVRDCYRLEKDKIEDAAQDLGIKLTFQIKSQRPSFTSSQRRKRRRLDDREDTPATYVWCSDSEDDEVIETPSKAPRKGHESSAIPENVVPKRLQTILGPMSVGPEESIIPRKIIISPLRLTTNYQGRESQRHPQFLFRTFNVSHGLTARKFLDNTHHIPSPPKMECDDFLAYVEPHLHVEIPYDSPFLSLAQSPKNALQPKRLRPCPDLAFAVFLYNDIERDATERFGLGSGPFLTPTICKTHDLMDLPRSPPESGVPYTGKGEFLVWGSIECQPLGILDAAEAILVRRVMETMAAINYSSGIRIGRCLQMISPEWRTSIAYQLLWSYKVPGHLTAKVSSQGNAFFRGVEDAAKLRPPSVIPEPEDQAIFDHLQSFPVATRDMWSPSEEPMSVVGPDVHEDHEVVVPITQPDLATNRRSRYEDEELTAPVTSTTNQHETPLPIIVPLNAVDSGWRSEDEEPVPDRSELTTRKIPTTPQKLDRAQKPRWQSSLENSHVSRTMTELKSEDQIEESTLSIVRKLNQNAGYLSDDDNDDNDDESMDSQNDISIIFTPATSTNSSPSEQTPGKNLTLKPTTVSLFRQQLSHFAAKKTPPSTTTAKNPIQYITTTAAAAAAPVRITKTTTTAKHKFIDLTSIADHRAMTPQQEEEDEEEYREIIRSIQARRRSRQHTTLSLRSRSTGPT